jgi:hypothetical protein
MKYGSLNYIFIYHTEFLEQTAQPLLIKMLELWYEVSQYGLSPESVFCLLIYLNISSC